MNEQRKGRFMLVMLVLAFALPVLAVVGLHVADWRPGGKSYGDLLQPPRVLDFPALQNARQQPFAAPHWRGKWHLVYVSHSGCEENCRKELHTLRQLHASLAKDIDRVQRVWLIAGTPPQQQVSQIQQQYPDLVVLPQAAALTVQFDLPRVPAESSGRVYLVDPMGHLMMSYPQGADPYGMRKDLMRLITYAWAG